MKIVDGYVTYQDEPDDDGGGYVRVARVMNWRREVAEYTGDKAEVAIEMCQHFGLVQARDGLWMPRCDLDQYEAGSRPVAGCEFCPREGGGCPVCE